MGQIVTAVLFCVLNRIRGPEDGTISEKLIYKDNILTLRKNETEIAASTASH
jgi:hypothetical protein